MTAAVSCRSPPFCIIFSILGAVEVSVIRAVFAVAAGVADIGRLLIFVARDRPVLTAVFMAVFDAHAAVHIAGFIPTDIQLRTVFCLMAVIAER